MLVVNIEDIDFDEVIRTLGEDLEEEEVGGEYVIRFEGDYPGIELFEWTQNNFDNYDEDSASDLSDFEDDEVIELKYSDNTTVVVDEL